MQQRAAAMVGSVSLGSSGAARAPGGGGGGDHRRADSTGRHERAANQRHMQNYQHQRHHHHQKQQHQHPKRISHESSSFSEGIASLNDALNSHDMAATLNSLEDDFDKISDPSTNSYIYCDAYKWVLFLDCVNIIQLIKYSLFNFT